MCAIGVKDASGFVKALLKEWGVLDNVADLDFDVQTEEEYQEEQGEEVSDSVRVKDSYDEFVGSHLDEFRKEIGYNVDFLPLDKSGHFKFSPYKYDENGVTTDIYVTTDNDGVITKIEEKQVKPFSDSRRVKDSNEPQTIQDVRNDLIVDLEDEYTDEQIQFIDKRLSEIMNENGLTLSELDDLCWANSSEMFSCIFDYKDLSECDFNVDDEPVTNKRFSDSRRVKDDANNPILHFHKGRGGRFYNQGYITYEGEESLSDFVAHNGQDVFLDEDGYYMDGAGNSLGTAKEGDDVGTLDFDGEYDTDYFIYMSDIEIDDRWYDAVIKAIKNGDYVEREVQEYVEGLEY